MLTGKGDELNSLSLSKNGRTITQTTLKGLLKMAALPSLQIDLQFSKVTGELKFSAEKKKKMMRQTPSSSRKSHLAEKEPKKSSSILETSMRLFLHNYKWNSVELHGAVG